MDTTLPDSARLWTFTASRALAPEEHERLMAKLEAFLAGWDSHGRPVAGAAELREGRLLVVAGHLEAGISGCGIDSLVRAAEEAAEALGFTWLDGLHVAFRAPGGEVEALPRPAFRALVRAGEVTAETPVFMTTLETLGELRQGGLERPAGEAWHARAFRIPSHHVPRVA